MWWQAATMCVIESSSRVMKTPFCVTLHIKLIQLESNEGEE